MGPSGEDLRNILVDPSFVDDTLIGLVQEMIVNRMQRTFTALFIDNQHFNVSICTAGPDAFLLEFEEDLDTSRSNRNELAQQLTAIGRILQEKLPEDDDPRDTGELTLDTARKACDVVMKLTGNFERGMVYRFKDDLSGEVLYEVKKEGIPTSYAGMRFPSGDIPQSARELYITNGLRYIFNVNIAPVDILSAPGVSIDLSHCRMRAVAVPLIVYLQNMGVVCSMSVSIVVENQLWGLLAFHGYSEPFRPGLHQRIAFETVSRMVSIRIESLMKREKSARLVKLAHLLSLVQQELPAEFICRRHQEVCDILRADAIAFKKGPNIYFFGEDASLRPGDDFWDSMIKYPFKTDLLLVSTRSQTKRLGLRDPCTASGFIYFQQSDLQFAALRTVRTKDVCWGGPPDQPKLQIGDILHPRKSFESYMEKAHTESKAWSKSDIEVTTTFKDQIVACIRSEALNTLNYDLETSNERCAEAFRLSARNYEFFAQMSHELRTPFHGVMACLEILQKVGHDPVEREEAIRIALRSGRSMMTVLNDILSAAKNKHGLELNEVEFLPSESFNQVTEVMRAFAESGHKQLVVNMAGSQLKEKWVQADRLKFEQVTSNLINNAIKFTQENGVVRASIHLFGSLREVEVRWKERASTFQCSTEVVEPKSANKDDRVWMSVEVEDTGLGIPSDEIEDIFQAYVQASSGVSKTHQGTGLGLHICSEHIRKMSGLFRCASAQGRGSLFFFSIPVGDQTQKEVIHSHSRQSSVHNKMIEVGILENLVEHILIVEDNKLNLKLACRKVSLLVPKSTVHCALDGKLGYELFLELHSLKTVPKLILMDYHMPIMSGIESIRLIRQWELEKSIQEPVWICCFTADLSEFSKQEILLAGANSFLSKPSPPGELEEKIRDALMN